MNWYAYLRGLTVASAISLFSGCAVSPKAEHTITPLNTSPTSSAAMVQEKNDSQAKPDYTVPALVRPPTDNDQTPHQSPRRLLNITRPVQTGTITSAELVEISGLAVSLKTPGVLFAINDSGNRPRLYALDENANHLGTWQIDAQNRDWEDMASFMFRGKPHLIIGDTGDNLKSRKHSVLHFFEEPTIDHSAKATPTALTPAYSIEFVFDDGPRNVEAFGAADGKLFLISKEPLAGNTPVASRLYRLEIPDSPGSQMPVARLIGSLPLLSRTLESRLAASIAGVDLDHITAMDFDSAADTAYLLTYRHVLEVVRKPQQSWAQAFSQASRRIHTHNLFQAEALAVSSTRAIWITSENSQSPLWALPITKRISN